MSNLFQKLELEAFRAGINPRTQESKYKGLLLDNSGKTEKQNNIDNLSKNAYTRK